VVGRRRNLLGTREEEQGIVAAPYKQALAIASGLLVGGFLFYRFGFVSNYGEVYGWEWYLGAVLLGAIGLAGVFPEARLSAAFGLAMAPAVIFCYEIFYLHAAESMWPIVLPILLFLSWPVPLIGSGISRLLTRSWLPATVYSVALTSALVIGALLPIINNAWRQRLETKTVPGLLKQIYDAEMIYSARQPDGNFTCDGTLLPGVAGNLGWTHSDERPKINRYLRFQYYNIRLDCPNATNPRSFGITASSNNGYIHAPGLSMDETGKLVVVPWH